VAATDQCTGTRPTAEDIRALSMTPPCGFDWGAHCYPAPDPYALEEDPLQPIVEIAIGYLEFVMCGQPVECVPAHLVPMLNMALLMRAQQWVFWTNPAVTEQQMTGIASFSAGSYSETTVTQHRQTSDRWVNPYPPLNDLLWMLMPPECREKWTAIVDPNKPDLPWFEVTSPDWQAFSSPGDFDWDPLFTTSPPHYLNRLDYWGWGYY
jgi:hypothetical protein